MAFYFIYLFVFASLLYIQHSVAALGVNCTKINLGSSLSSVSRTAGSVDTSSNSVSEGTRVKLHDVLRVSCYCTIGGNNVIIMLIQNNKKKFLAN